MRRWMLLIAVMTTLSACASPDSAPALWPAAGGKPGAVPSTQRPATTKPTVGATATKPSPLKSTVAPGVDGGAKPPAKPSGDGVPVSGAGTFTVSPGDSGRVGAGATLVTYQTQVENGIAWGGNPVWTPASFGETVDAIIADPRGWTASAASPITDAAQHQSNASYAFRRVGSGSASVRIVLATPNTTDRLCATAGLDTGGVYSCRYGSTIVINLRRWLKGAPGFAMNLAGYRTMVINHEMGHRLGFDHMRCPGSGRPAPVMQQETMNLGGCVPNAYPFAADGTFITGPWASS